MSVNKSPKVMLISPPLLTPGPEEIPLNTQPPLGIAYIAAALERQGYAVAILDAFTETDAASSGGGATIHHGLSASGISAKIADFSPDIVGISSMYTMYAQGAHLVAAFVKKLNNRILVVCGGPHATLNPGMVLQDRAIDFVVSGEGEITFLELVRAYEAKQDIRALPGLIYAKEGDIVINPSRPLIEDLDSLAYPARHLLPMRRYFENIPRAKNYNIRHPAVTLSSSRGCPQDCIYCAVQKIWGTKWRSRSAEGVVDEIGLLARDYGAREVHFTDDSISVDRQRLQQICRQLIRRKIDIKWTAPAGIAIWHLDEELLRLMKRSGCYRLTFGLESGNARTLRFIGKNYTYEQARRIIGYAGKLGIWTAGTFIIGFPHETKEMIAETTSFARDCGLDFAVFYTPVIFPGTPLFDVFAASGIKYDPAITGINRAYETRYVTEKELFAIRLQAGKAFLRRRAMRFLKSAQKIKNPEDLRYLIKLAANLIHSYQDRACDKKSAFGFLRTSRARQ